MGYYKQPKYFRNFQCIGGKCPSNCCRFWRIDWDNQEVEKLKSANCSPELKSLIETSFKPRANPEDGMQMVFVSDKNRQCKLLDENGFCRIQKELGVEYMSKTCMIYPRTVLISNNIVTRVCHSSCYEVMRTLFNDEKSMELYNAPFEGYEIKTKGIQDTKEDIQANPELKYRNQLTDFFYEIINNKKRSVETSLLLGALAAQKLTEYIDRGQAERIPEIIKALHPQLNTLNVASFDNVKINYNISLDLAAKMVDIFLKSNVLDPIKTNGQLDIELYEKGRAIFSEYEKAHPHVLRNIALNFLLEGHLPLMKNNSRIFDNYCYYIATLAAARLILTASSLVYKEINDTSIITLAFCVRGFYHTIEDNYPKILDLLKKSGCKSPAFIALLLK